MSGLTWIALAVVVIFVILLSRRTSERDPDFGQRRNWEEMERRKRTFMGHPDEQRRGRDMGL
jgi:hypothetical protein